MYFARWGVALVSLCGAVAPAQELQPASGKRHRNAVPCPPDASPMPGVTPEPAEVTQAPSASFNEALVSAGESGTQPAASYMPSFFGDLLGGFGTKLIAQPNSTP